MSTYSRSPPVEPSPYAQASLVPRRLHLPRRRHDHLLVVLEPQGAPARCRIPASWLNTTSNHRRLPGKNTSHKA